MTQPTPIDAQIGALFLAQARDRMDASCRLIRHCANQLDEDQFWWRPRPSHNSVGNLVLHVTGNLRERLLTVVAGEPGVRDRAEEFACRGPIAKETILARLEEVVRECDQLLAALPVPRLLEARSYQGINRRFDLHVLSVIFQSLSHLAGHAQEIVFCTRLQVGDSYQFSNPPAGAPSPAPRSTEGEHRSP